MIDEITRASNAANVQRARAHKFNRQVRNMAARLRRMDQREAELTRELDAMCVHLVERTRERDTLQDRLFRTLRERNEARDDLDRARHLIRHFRGVVDADQVEIHRLNNLLNPIPPPVPPVPAPLADWPQVLAAPDDGEQVGPDVALAPAAPNDYGEILIDALAPEVVTDDF